MPRKQNPEPISAAQQQELVSEGIENFELPKSVVMKIAKAALPDEARLTKETVLSLVKGSTVFINYLAATAHDIAIAKQHKSIAATDVLRALELLDFGDLVEPLTQELALYKDSSANKSTKSKSGSKGLSISIPPQASISSASTSVSSNPKITLTVRPSANGQDKGKAKASNVDRDGDEEMRGADEEDEGDESRMNSPVGGGRDGDESRVASEEREGLQEMDPPPPTSPSVAASVGDGANPS
ncbi:hypothetical protein CC1G_12238 [Coprinopsis cinerea okayama7|uniref:DNA polymerase epsilon subunit D n=1 Tax=Coprinopsis cinerea (strain Okayama-7 / 130 / ATCC MYA-4618 / FGSC 9003) TaxID=240176 RepID=A8P1W6_COPC7|nr:hypothetical protein CC1G_12238 [Coprinopsis cinerea okayama7\|eukprot:XP_001838189.1 hypothetical protein CC1G_12238 [Coprinopsis cinerea okayama7\